MGRAAKVICLGLLVAPTVLSLIDLPGESVVRTSGIGAFAFALTRNPLYAGSTTAWSLLPLFAIQLLLSFLVAGDSATNDEESRARLARTRTLFFAGTALLAGGVAVFDAWAVQRRSSASAFAILCRSGVVLALVATALEVTRREAGSGIAALASGDFIARAQSTIRHRVDAEVLRAHAPELLIIALFAGLFFVVLKEAPASARFARFASVRARLFLRWPVVVAALAACALLLVRVWDLEVHSATVLEEPIAFAGLLIGGLAAAVVLDGDSAASSAVGLAIFPPAERALVPFLTAFVVNMVLTWRTASLLPAAVERVVWEAAHHAPVLCGVAGAVALGLEVVAFRRAKLRSVKE